MDLGKRKDRTEPMETGKTTAGSDLKEDYYGINCGIKKLFEIDRQMVHVFNFTESLLVS